MKDKLRALAARRRAPRRARGRPRLRRHGALARARGRRTRGGSASSARTRCSSRPALGSCFLLGELLIDLELRARRADPPTPRCGTCTRCLDACPTGAFVDAYVLDARRCISYLTIELARRHPARAAPAHRRPHLRLRHLPGGVSVQRAEPTTARDRRASSCCARLRAPVAASSRARRGAIPQVAAARRCARDPAAADAQRRRRPRQRRHPDELPALMQRSASTRSSAATPPGPSRRSSRRSELGPRNRPRSSRCLAAALVRETDDDARADLEAALSSARTRRGRS